MAYDSGIVSFTTKTNKVDLVDAAHINAVQSELVTIETILGTNVKGTMTDLKTRLNNALDSDGSILSGTSFPSPALYPSQLFFRTDTNVLYIRNAANSAWATVASATNIQIFTSSGTFTAPTGITKVYVSMIGAGGGGGGGGQGGSFQGGGGGGAAGQFILNYPYTVVAGNNYTVTLNAGGAGGAAGGSNADGSTGSTGGTSVFDTITVQGGAGGVKNTGNAGGNGGTASGSFHASASVSTAGTAGGGSVIAGGNGAAGTINAGGGGGGSPFATGATGSTSSTVSSTPSFGAGGGGGRGGISPDFSAGGAGGTGICIVFY